MNGHRTAIAALLAAARDERSRAAGPNGTLEERARLDDRIAALDAALTSGDEAEAGDEDAEWNADIRAGVEARFEVDALRRSLARALGRRMFTRPLFGVGPEQDVPPPADAVMLSEVDELLRKGREHEAMVTDLREMLGLPRSTTAEQALVVLRERLTPADTDTSRED